MPLPRTALFLLVGAGLLSAQFAENPAAAAKELFPKNESLRQLRLADTANYLQLRAGSKVADVGCGEGELALIWSRTVGPSGHVYAEDIDEKNALAPARKNVKKFHASNVTVIRGTLDDPKLPTGQLDGISLEWVYHELTKYPEMLGQFKRALKPEGRLVIIDPLARKTATQARDVQTKNHVLMPDLAEAEIRAAGFDIVHREDHFLDFPDQEGIEWIIVASPHR